MNRIQFQTIANEVGVNVRTIYRVMNNNGAVSNSTRKKVVNALNRYGYLCAGQRKSENIVFDICKNEFVERIGIQLMQSLSMQDFKCIPTNHMENRERFMAAVSDASVVVMCSFQVSGLLMRLNSQIRIVWSSIFWVEVVVMLPLIPMIISAEP